MKFIAVILVLCLVGEGWGVRSRLMSRGSSSRASFSGSTRTSSLSNTDTNTGSSNYGWGTNNNRPSAPSAPASPAYSWNVPPSASRAPFRVIPGYGHSSPGGFGSASGAGLGGDTLGTEADQEEAHLGAGTGSQISEVRRESCGLRDGLGNVAGASWAGRRPSFEVGTDISIEELLNKERRIQRDYVLRIAEIAPDIDQNQNQRGQHASDFPLDIQKLLVAPRQSHQPGTMYPYQPATPYPLVGYQPPGMSYHDIDNEFERLMKYI